MPLTKNCRIFTLISIILVCGACSTMNTRMSVQTVREIIEGKTYQLRVRTGHAAMDQLVYELALNELGQYIPLAEKEPYAGTVDVVFVSSGEGMFLGSTMSSTTSTASVTGWYTGNGSLVATGTGSAVTTGVVSGTTFTWQNSTMIVAIKDDRGKRLWSADYKYKGGWEMSGWYVNTPDEAARLCLERISTRFKEDLPQ